LLVFFICVPYPKYENVKIGSLITERQNLTQLKVIYSGAYYSDTSVCNYILKLVADMCHVTANEPRMDTSSQLHRIQKLMLALLPRFVVSESLLRELTGSATISTTRTSAISGPDAQQTEPAAGQDKMEAVLRFFQVACHLVLYARNIVASHGVDHRASTVIFKASLVEPGMTAERRMRGKQFVGTST
jgi:hypothetical protein